KGNSYQAAGHELSNPQALWDKFIEGKEPVVLGRKAIGKFKSAYPEGITSEKNSKKSNETAAPLTESQKESAVIVFADVDFIHDQFSFKNTFLGLAVANDNSALF